MPSRRDMRAVVSTYTRTPFHRSHKGALKDTRPEDMSSAVISSVLNSANLEAASIEDVIVGCAYPEGEQGLNIGRISTYLADMPNTVPGMTINRLCGSSMQAIHTAAGALSIGSGEAMICAGVESMSRIQRGGFNRLPHPELESAYPEAYISMGITAENIASRDGITRQEQEEFAAMSHEKAIRAMEMGNLSNEIVTVSNVSEDGCMRKPDLDKMATLSPAFLGNGSVTAATSSPLTDGAAATLVSTEEYAESYGIESICQIVSTAVAGVPPEFMGYGPVPASEKALSRAGINLDDLDVIELNEAFSAQALGCMLGIGIEVDDERLNIDGGALAIGHPLGASGCRIVGKTADLLSRTGGEYGLATMCIGGGMGIATIIRRI